MIDFTKNFVKRFVLLLSFCLLPITTTWSYITKKNDPSQPPDSDKNTSHQSPNPNENVLLLNEHDEVINYRTEFSKTYYRGDDVYELISMQSPQHYLAEDNTFQDINTTIVNGHVDKTIYRASLLPNEFGYQIQNKNDQGGFVIKLKSIGGIQPAYREPRIEKNTAIWENIVDGIDLEIIFNKTSAHLVRHIKTPQAPNDFIWSVEEDIGKKSMSLRKEINGYDSKERPTLNERIKLAEETRGGKIYYEYNDLFKRSIIEMDKNTRRKKLAKNVNYPVELASNIKREDNSPHYPVMIDPTVTASTANADGGWGYRNNTTAFIQTANCVGCAIYNGKAGTALYVNSHYWRFGGITLNQSIQILDGSQLEIYSWNNNNDIKIHVKGKELNDPANPTLVSQITAPGTIAAATYTKKTGTVINSYITFSVKNIVQELIGSFSYTNQHMLFFTTAVYNAVSYPAWKIKDEDAGAPQPGILRIKYRTRRVVTVSYLPKSKPLESGAEL